MRCDACGRTSLGDRLKDRRKVRRKEELEAILRLPVVGLLPQVAQRHHGDAIVVLDKPRSASAEAYRTLRTSLMFMGIDKTVKCVQVTSATPGEGTTTVVTNLAAACVQAGMRVILLDCNLRRPMVHEAFGVSNDRGFTSVLRDECPLVEAVVNVEEEPFLAILPAGPVPPNPSELLSSERAKVILATLREHCDLLLIDTPPVLPTTDALVFSGHVDATLLVARTKGSTRREITRVGELLRQVKAPLVGTVLNGVKDGGYGYTGYSGGGPSGPASPPPEGGPSGPRGGGQPPSEGGGPSSDRARRNPPGPPDKSGHLAKSVPEPDLRTTGRANPGPTATRSGRVKEGSR